MKFFLKLMGLALVCFVLGVLFGCASASHSRSVETVGPDGKVVARTTDKETVRATLMKGVVDNVHSVTKDGSYSHAVGASGLQAAGDVEMLRELRGMFKDGVEAGMKGAVEGAK